MPSKKAAGGPFAIFLGLLLCVFTLSYAQETGKFGIFSSALGPMLAVLGIGLTVIPEDKLFVQIGTNEYGEPVYDYRRMSLKPHYIWLMLGSITCGVLFTTLLYTRII
jgi:hypothetical protein